MTLQNKVTADFTSQWSKDDAETYSAVSGISVPFHPGAEKYFKEVGAIK